MKRLVVLSAVAILLPTVALARPACAPRVHVVQQLAEHYAEAPVAVALANNGALIEVLLSKGGETFTILLTTPNGISCMVAAGTDWQGHEPEALAFGDPA